MVWCLQQRARSVRPQEKGGATGETTTRGVAEGEGGETGETTMRGVAEGEGGETGETTMRGVAEGEGGPEVCLCGELVGEA